MDATLSYAGRVSRPRAQPIPTRTGGFGGPGGLAVWMREHAVTHLIDATHPFAAVMSRNAAEAAALTKTPLLALVRPPWRAEVGDAWTEVADMQGAVATLTGPRRRVMLAIGRGGVENFAAAPQHFYLLRYVDPPGAPPPLPDCAVEVSRGPFTEADDIALMRRHRIDIVVAKNAGGDGARAKLLASRALNVPVVMIARPSAPVREEAETPDAVLDWVEAGHGGVLRGV